jgi:hypothetical protein
MTSLWLQSDAMSLTLQGVQGKTCVFFQLNYFYSFMILNSKLALLRNYFFHLIRKSLIKYPPLEPIPAVCSCFPWCIIVFVRFAGLSYGFTCE